MLGYNFNVDILSNANFIDRRTEEELLSIEKERLDFFKSVCNKLNIKLSADLKIHNLSEPANEIIKADMQKHPENNEILDELLGKNREKSFYRGHVTNPDSPFFIDFTQNLPTPREVADTIHNAGGIVVLPHVFEYKSVDNIKFLNEIYSMGILDGLECVHTRHNEEQVKYLENYCKEKGLLMSGGSDFHLEQKQTLGYTSLGPIDDKYCLKRL